MTTPDSPFDVYNVLVKMDDKYLSCLQIAVLVTTGPQDVHDPLSTPLADAAAQLQNAGVDVYSFGIGPNVVPSELETVASRPEYVFRAQTTSLPILSSQLTEIIRQGKLYQHLLCLQAHISVM